MKVCTVVIVCFHMFSQVQGFEKARSSFGSVSRYRGFFHCLGTVYKEEGALAFYKGAVPTVLKVKLSLCLLEASDVQEELVSKYILNSEHCKPQSHNIMSVI